MGTSANPRFGDEEQSWNFTPANEMIGLWGLERRNIKQIGVVTFDTSCDPDSAPTITPIVPIAIPKINPKDAKNQIDPTKELDESNLIITICCVVIAGCGLAIGVYFVIKNLLKKEKISKSPPNSN